MSQHEKLFLGFAAVAMVLMIVLVYVFFLSDDSTPGPAPEELTHNDSLKTAVEDPVPNGTGEAAESHSEEVVVEDDYPPVEELAPMDIDVYRRGQVMGRVVHENKRPVAGAEVFLYHERKPYRRVDEPMLPTEKKILQTTTDRDGTFFFTNIPGPARYGVVATLEGFMALNRPTVRVKPRQEQTTPDIILGQGWRIFGTVRDAAGAPLEGALVFLELNSEEELDLDRVKKAKEKAARRKKTRKQVAEETFNAFVAGKKKIFSDEGGRFDFGPVASGSYRVGALADGYATIINKRVNTAKADRKKGIELDLTLSPPLTISGRVLDKNRNSIPGVQITAEKSKNPEAFSWARTVSADDNGTFVLKNLLPGRYVITGRKQGYKPGFATNIEAGTSSVHVRMDVTASITGLVLDSNTKKPVNDFLVAVCSLPSSISEAKESIRGWERCKTDDGRFKVESLQWGRFVIVIRSDEFGVGRSEPVDLEMSEQGGPVTIMVSKGHSLNGKVLDSKSKPVKGARVSLFKGRDQSGLTQLLGVDPADVLQEDRSIYPAAMTDEKGLFELTNLDPDLYNLKVSHPDFRDEMLHEVIVEKKGKNYAGKVMLRQGGTLEGMVYDREGKPCSGIILKILGSQGTYLARSSDSGEFRIVKMTPGEYDISPQATSSPFTGSPESALTTRDSIPVFVAEGETTKTEIHLR